MFIMDTKPALEWDKPTFLRDLRKRVGMTQSQLAALCEFSRHHVDNFERGLVRIQTADALQLYRALATKDTTGEALAAAAAALRRERQLLKSVMKQIRQEQNLKLEDKRRQIQMINESLKSLGKIG